MLMELAKVCESMWHTVDEDQVCLVKKCETSVYCVSPGHALIRYSNLGSAVYAKEKLNGFEYPPGNRLVVNFIEDGEDRSGCINKCRKSFMYPSALKMGPNVTTNKSPRELFTV